MMHRSLQLFIVLVMLTAGEVVRAGTPHIGMTIETHTEEGFSLNPVVTKILITKVSSGSLSEVAGLHAGDEILQINGQALGGKRAFELQPLMKWNPGETRKFHLRRSNGEQYDAEITKPKE